MGMKVGESLLEFDEVDRDGGGGSNVFFVVVVARS